MEISAEGKIGIGLTLVFALGAGALAVWPETKIIGWATMALAALGLISLIIYHVTEARQSEEVQVSEEDGKKGKGTTGFRFTDCEDMFVSNNVSIGKDEDFVEVRGKRNQWTGNRAVNASKAGTEKAKTPRKYFGGFSFSKGDHLKK